MSETESLKPEPAANDPDSAVATGDNRPLTRRQRRIADLWEHYRDESYLAIIQKPALHDVERADQAWLSGYVAGLADGEHGTGAKVLCWLMDREIDAQRAELGRIAAPESEDGPAYIWDRFDWAFELAQLILTLPAPNEDERQLFKQITIHSTSY